MTHGSDPYLLRVALDAATEQRDAAIAASHAALRDAEVQRRQLIAEQDRFVSHLLETHERDLERLRGELRAAAETIARLNGELALARSMLSDAMADDTARRSFKSVQPTSAQHRAQRPQRESGVVGRLLSEKPAGRVDRPRRT